MFLSDGEKQIYSIKMMCLDLQLSESLGLVGATDGMLYYYCSI